LYVIDEVAVLFNSRLWANTDKVGPDLMAFLAGARKSASNVMLIAQRASRVDRAIREMCDMYLLVTSTMALAKYHLWPSWLRSVLGDYLIVQRFLDPDLSTSMDWSVRPVRRETWKSFDSYSFSLFQEAITEARSHRGK